MQICFDIEKSMLAVAHRSVQSGGVVKHNREEALQKYLQRLIKTGKKLNAAQQQQLERLTGKKYVDLVPNATPDVSAATSSKTAPSKHNSAISKRTSKTAFNSRNKTAKKTGKAKKKSSATASVTKTACVKTNTRIQKDMQEITNMMAGTSVKERKQVVAAVTDKKICQDATANPVTKPMSATDLFKKRRRLAKKLRQIDALKARQQKGEEMSALQLQKLNLESSIRQQLDELPASC